MLPVCACNPVFARDRCVVPMRSAEVGGGGVGGTRIKIQPGSKCQRDRGEVAPGWVSKPLKKERPGIQRKAPGLGRKCNRMLTCT